MATARLGLLRRQAAGPSSTAARLQVSARCLASSSTAANKPEVKTKQQAHSTTIPLQKNRRLSIPYLDYRGLSEAGMQNALASLKLRKMPYSYTDFERLRTAKRRLGEIVGQRATLAAEQKSITAQMSKIIAQQKVAQKQKAAQKSTSPKAKGAKKAGKDEVAKDSDSSAAEAASTITTDTGAEGMAATGEASTDATTTDATPPASGEVATSTPAEDGASAGPGPSDSAAENASGEEPVIASEDATLSADASTKEVAAKSEAEELGEKLASLRQRAKTLKDEIARLVSEDIELRQWSLEYRLAWPNALHPEVPVGPEPEAIVVKVEDPGQKLPASFDVVKQQEPDSVLQLKHFPPNPKPDPTRDHLTLASSLRSGHIDMAAGVLSTGSSWPYLMGTISLLEHALSQYALDVVIKQGFTAVSPPDVVRAELADRCGFRPRDEKAKQTYFLEGDKPKSTGTGAKSDPQRSLNDLCLAATAEIPLASLLAAVTFPSSPSQRRGGSLVESDSLPVKLVALGHAFRAEAGARGADTRGLYRVHQFTKVEMVVATSAEGSESDEALERLREIQESIIGSLGLPYRVLDMPTEELGASAYRKYDIEVWMPGRGSWGEVSSASNCTDYQARRLLVRYQTSPSDSASDDTKKNEFAHTLNATAAAIPRLVVAILENYGVADGKLVLPAVLRPYWLGGDAKKDSVHWRAKQRVWAMAERNGTDPASMVVAFGLMHELTAIVPLVLLFYLLSALGAGEATLNWLQGGEEKDSGGDGSVQEAGLVAGYIRAWIDEGMVRAERYGRKMGFFGFDRDGNVEGTAAETDVSDDASKRADELIGSFANAVAAYALVKALLPVRIAASIALAGPVARTCIEPIKKVAGRLLAGRGAKAVSRPMA
ncbi:uncharacterized protein PFL1_02288 [Pseudozyma flocculosa PF-1]|uniref:uncharacterized protein n=1 Tax=Pseudozyma flocculosa PF-1 TaxID=1277687 RepID=UPI000456149E|nr:uncharacterized protein PFL1_02288 [Pseudozyma flocculosa PF-1]EPQ30172.1 hypothetical protein PFL1_02288 [Pseudozyma flocculosa PF-1]